MSWITLVLLAHILGVLGLMAGLATEWASARLMERSADRAQLLVALGVAETNRWIYPPSGLTVLVSGLVLATAYRGAQAPWIAASLIALFAMALVGGLGTGRQMMRLGRALTGQGEALSEEAALAIAHSPRLRVSLHVRSALMVTIVVLMVLQPGLLVTAVVLAAGVALGLATGLRRAPGPARALG